MKKSLFIIPGFKQQVSDSRYQWMVRYYGERGYVVKEVNVTWNNRVMSDYVQEFLDYYYSNKTGENHIIGFSYGAMIALIAARELKLDSLVLCSLSPYFNEDLQNLKLWWKIEVGLKRVEDFRKYKAIRIARSITVPTVVLYGTVEGNKYPQLKVRCEETAKYIKNARLVVVDGAPHDIDHPTYREAIKEAFL